ncbi:MAG: hypothetical protein ACM35G_05255 [Planctomycetaceae bacterium]
MGWKRINNHDYFYARMREGGRSVLRYLGGGLAGQLAAARIQERRGPLREARRRMLPAERELDGWCKAVDRAVAADLVALGYHRRQGRWWRKRVTKKAIEEAKTKGAVPAPSQGEGTALVELSRRAQAGDLAALAEFGILAGLTAGPGGETEAGRALVRGVAERLAALKAELLGPDPTPIERLLVERVATCWLRLHLRELAVTASAAERRPHPEVLEFHTRQLDRAHQRYLTSLTARAKVRRLGQPAVRVSLKASARYTEINHAAPGSGQARLPEA